MLYLLASLTNTSVYRLHKEELKDRYAERIVEKRHEEQFVRWFEGKASKYDIVLISFFQATVIFTDYTNLKKMEFADEATI